MIEDDAFAGHVRAHLAYAMGVGSSEGERIIAMHLTNGTWKEAPFDWRTAASVVPNYGGTVTFGAWLDRWLDQVRADNQGLTNDVRHVLPDFTRCRCNEPEPERFLADLAEWFDGQAKPGHANTCSDVLAASWVKDDSSHLERIPPELLPMVKWLLAHGAAELRWRPGTEPDRAARASQTPGPARPDRRDLAARLVDAAHRAGADDALTPALRYLVYGANAVPGFTHQVLPAGQWPAIERALAQGAPASLAVDIAMRLVESGKSDARMIWAPLSATDLPRARAALLGALTAGSFDMKAAQIAWLRLLDSEPVGGESVAFASRGAAMAALAALEQRVIGPRAADDQTIAPWVEIVVAGLLTVLGVPAGRPLAADIERVVQRVGAGRAGDRLDALERALRRVLPPVTAPGSASLARRLVEDDARQLSRVRAALRVLSALEGDPAPATVRERADLSPLQGFLEELIQRPWHEPVFGVALGWILGPASEILLTSLDSDDKVRATGHVVAVDDSYFRDMIACEGWTERARQLSALYFLHELVHIAQGIADYENVQRVRSTGAEMTLMHLDLAADHAAALMAAHAVPRWELHELKELTATPSPLFPASTFHTDAARHRKGARLVSHRLDLMIRRSHAALAERLCGGYAFADYGPSGGHLLIMMSGPPTMVVKVASLEPKDAGVLMSAADDHPSTTDIVGQIDAILASALSP